MYSGSRTQYISPFRDTFKRDATRNPDDEESNSRGGTDLINKTLSNSFSPVKNIT